MVSRDAAKGKHYEGPVHGGEGKQNLLGTKPYEYMGVHKSGPNPKLTPAIGYTSQHDGREEHRTFMDTPTASYGGPQRVAFTAKDLGVRNPDDLEHSA